MLAAFCLKITMTTEFACEIAPGEQYICSYALDQENFS